CLAKTETVSCELAGTPLTSTVPAIKPIAVEISLSAMSESPGGVDLAARIISFLLGIISAQKCHFSSHINAESTSTSTSFDGKNSPVLMKWNMKSAQMHFFSHRSAKPRSNAGVHRETLFDTTCKLRSLELFQGGSCLRIS